MISLLFFTSRKTSNRDVLEYEDSFLTELQRRTDGPIRVLPHLYDLSETGEAAAALRSCAGPTIALSWLAPRATYWLLRNLGLQGEITCFDLAETQTPEGIPGLSAESPESPGRLLRIEEPTVRRWYPVVDENACLGCLECVNYCMFGVYEIGAGDRPKVGQPDRCRDGCPACSRICPGSAIIFPEYDDPLISGRVVPKKPDVSQPSSGDDLDRLIEEAEED